MGAVTEMNGRIIVAKPLYVPLAQRKEDRKAHLTQQYIQRVSGMRMQQQFAGQMGFPQQTGYFLPTMATQQHPQRFFGQPQGMRPGMTPRWAQAQPRGQMQPNMMQGGPHIRGNRHQKMMGGPGGLPMGPTPMMAPMMAPRPGMVPPVAGNPGMRPNFKYTAGVRNVAGAGGPPAVQVPVQL